MPISVGEVNATLRFNIIQDQLEVAKQNLKELVQQFNDVGGAATEAGQAMQANLTQAQAGVLGLQSQFSSLGDGISQVDRLATRMVERLLIFYAIRETFSFINDVYESAAALQQLSEKTQFSIQTLSTFEHAGESVGISTKTLDQAVESLHKNFTNLKMSSADALAELGLSYDKLFQMSPDERFNAVMKALEGVTDATERSRLAMVLLGTDAIDPLIKSFDSLTEAAKKNVASEEQVRALANTDRAYRELFQTIKDGGAFAINMGADFAQIVATPFFAFLNDGTLAERFRNVAVAERQVAENLGLIRNAVGDINLPAPAKPGIPPGEKFLIGLENRSGAQTEDDDVMDNRLQRLKDIGMLTEQMANAVGVTTERYRQFTADSKDNTAELAKNDAALIKEFNDITKLNDAIVKENTARRQSEESLNKVLDLRSTMTDSQVKLQKELDSLTMAQSRLADLNRELELEKQIFATKNAAMETEKGRKALLEDFARVTERLNTSILSEQTKINALYEQQAVIIRQIRQANAEAVGQNLQGLPSDKNINPADAAERHFEETMENARRALERGAIQQNDYNEVLKAAQRTFMEEISSTEKVTKANKDLAAAEEPVVQAAKVGSATPGGPTGPVTVNVTGVLDPATIRLLAAEVGKAMMTSSNRQFPSR